MIALLFAGLRLRGLGDAIAVDGKIRAIHSAKIAAGTLLWIDVRGDVVTLGVELLGEGQSFAGAKLHTDPAGLTSFNYDGDSTARHGTSFLAGEYTTTPAAEPLLSSTVLSIFTPCGRS
jgi:hypothetical protein